MNLHTVVERTSSAPRMYSDSGLNNAHEKIAPEITSRTRLEHILAKGDLNALFQPIIDLQRGEIIGYEGLIRGPSDSPLHSPLELFKEAAACGLSVELETLCQKVVLRRFAELALPGRLFLNVSPEMLLHAKNSHARTMRYVRENGINPQLVIIELTESHPGYDYKLLCEAVTLFRNEGFRIAIDDLGEGFSSLRLWSELRPDFVKVDKHFVQGINQDPVKLQFVRSINEIARESGTLVIAEGIETESELLLVRDIGISHGQGFYISHPLAAPARALPEKVMDSLSRHGIALYPRKSGFDAMHATAAKLVRAVAPVTPEMNNNQVYERFRTEPDLQSLAVVEGGVPIGLITRPSLVDRFAQPYIRELYGRKSCAAFMDRDPILTDRNTSLQELSRVLVEADRHHLSNGFVITEDGAYIGMGSGQDLMREITELQIRAARYANPLTLLPGNVPISEHIQRLLSGGVRFAACYADLDYFKPYNDVYGYSRGDEVIQMAGRVFCALSDPARDFVGHIGGDDFLILFQSEDWEARCQLMLSRFEAAIGDYFDPADRERGGYVSEDRRGSRVFHPLINLSLGIVRVQPGQFHSHHQIAAAAAEAKKQAKKVAGNSMFVERRHA